MKTANRVEINRKIMLGKPVIRVTWALIALILRKLDQGASEADLPDADP